MSAGQLDDLTEPDRAAASIAASRAVVEAKSGAQFSMYARLGALLAGAPAQRIEAYAGYGMALASAAQVESDLFDLLNGPSQDLYNGKVTLPVAAALARLEGDRREAFIEALTKSRTSAAWHEPVREGLKHSGALAYTALAIETYVHRALANLDAGGPSSPATHELRRIAREASLLPRAVGERK